MNLNDKKIATVIQYILTNLNEEKFLGNITGQKNMAELMFQAFEKYRNQIDGKNTIQDKLNIPAIETPPIKIEVGEDTTGLVFRVQIATSDKQLLNNHNRFSGLTIYEYQQDKLFKYCTGIFFNDLVSAKKLKTELIQKGFENAFVVAFLNGERISIEKAIKLAEK